MNEVGIYQERFFTMDYVKLQRKKECSRLVNVQSTPFQVQTII